MGMFVPREIKEGQEAWSAILSGISKVSKAVKSTLGPRGRNVILDRILGRPVITNDGVTIAKEMFFEDVYENMGAQLLKEVALQTNIDAGDGTTTATVLAEAIYKEGIKNIMAGANPMDLKRGILKASVLVNEELVSQAKAITTTQEMVDVATISANNDEEIGKLIGEAIDKAGLDGVIDIDGTSSLKSTLEVVNGMQIDQGYVSPYMTNNPAGSKTEFGECFVMITSRMISRNDEIIGALETSVREKKPLVIIAGDIEREALGTLVANIMERRILAVGIKAPSCGRQQKDLLEDIATLTGGKVIAIETGMNVENFKEEWFGRASKVTVTKDSTTIVADDRTQKEVKERIEKLKGELEDTKDEDTKKGIKKRIAKLSGGIVVLQVGAPTPSELKEKKFRAEDALNATQAAKAEGIVIGGGGAYVHATKKFDELVKNFKGDELTGAILVKKALYEPLKQIAANAGIEGMYVVNKLLENDSPYGYDAQSLEYGDMYEKGIIDPVKVARLALQNAASIAGLLLTTNVLVGKVDIKEVKDDIQS